MYLAQYSSYNVTYCNDRLCFQLVQSKQGVSWTGSVFMLIDNIPIFKSNFFLKLTKFLKELRIRCRIKNCASVYKEQKFDNF